MKETTVIQLDESDKTLISDMRRIGMSRKAAGVLAFLMKSEGTSRDIERAVDLRQPEVSIGIRELGPYVKSTYVERKDKGRPYYTHKLVGNASDVIREYQAKLSDDFTTCMDVCDRLCQLLDSQKK